MSVPPSGIYKITNMLNGKVYIGQTQNLWKRKAQHFVALRRGHHENREMQKDWDTNNRGFRWDIVEYCSLEQLNDREEYWINQYDSINKGYNQGWVPYKRKVKKAPKRKIKGYRKRS